MNKAVFISMILTLSSCALVKKEIPEIESLNISNGHNLSLRPGDTKLVKLSLKSKNYRPQITCEGKNVDFNMTNNSIKAFIAIPYGYKKETYSCDLFYQGKFIGPILKAKIRKVKYKTSYIKVPKRKVDYQPSDIGWIKNDKAILTKLYKNIDSNKIYFSQSFSKPLISKITSPYGAKRIFNNKKSSWHSGIDFRARTGTPIPVSNDGKVILVRHLFFNGKTVIVDHGMGVLSLYSHLSRYKVKEGDLVKRGSIIGLGGNTGRSSGPHLHWGVRVQNNWVNGFSVIKESESL